MNGYNWTQHLTVFCSTTNKSMSLETANRTNTSLQHAQELNSAPPAIQHAFLVTCDLSKEAAGQKNRLRELKTRNDFLTIPIV